MHFIERPLDADRVRFVSWSLFAAAMILFALVQPAFGYNDNVLPYPMVSQENCEPCHYPYSGGVGLLNGTGVHRGYVTTSNKCKQCHSVHNADQFGQKLLPGPTISDGCNTCHDGSGGRGVYGVIKARTGVDPLAQHRTEATNVVPGGNAANGGDATMTLSAWSDGTLSCIDCHSVHGASTVASFTGDRIRGPAFGLTYTTSKLLKQRPGNVATPTAVYGSDWCIACHKGRDAATPLHNHPVETSASVAPAAPYWYNDIAVVATYAPTATVTTGSVGASNRAYLMPFPRRGAQVGHNPICQQCHEDARNTAVGGVGSLSADGNIADVATYTPTLDGTVTVTNPNPNPRFATFPHEGVNPRFLVETYDDLCLNCHPPAGLP